MNEVWRSLGLRQLRVTQLSSLRQEVDMRRAIVLPGKHDMSDLVIALKKTEMKSEDIPVYMHQGHTETQHLKDNN